jgi:hypothetical protein
MSSCTETTSAPISLTARRSAGRSTLGTTIEKPSRVSFLQTCRSSVCSSLAAALTRTAARRFAHSVALSVWRTALRAAFLSAPITEASRSKTTSSAATCAPFLCIGLLVGRDYETRPRRGCHGHGHSGLSSLGRALIVNRSHRPSGVSRPLGSLSRALAPTQRPCPRQCAAGLLALPPDLRRI